MAFVLLCCLLLVVMVTAAKGEDCLGEKKDQRVIIYKGCPYPYRWCGTYGTRPRLSVTCDRNTKDCGGCADRTTTQRACNVRVARGDCQEGECGETVVQKYCCPDTNLINPTTCAECGASSSVATLIRGGDEAKPGQFPWQVFIRIKAGRRTKFCGAVIIADQWLLTAAHCVSGSDLDLSASSAVLAKGILGQQVTMALEAVRINPGYDSSRSGSQHDIALIKTSAVISFSRYISPVCLPDFWDTYYFNKATISGWGDTEGYRRGISSVLKYASVTIIPVEWCTQPGLANLLCTYAVGGQAGTACFGDSGGPMTVVRRGRVHLIGVAWWSFAGVRCSLRYPFGYTDIGPYLAWIRAAVL